MFLKAHAVPCPFLPEQIQQNECIKKMMPFAMEMVSGPLFDITLQITLQQLILFCCGVFLLHVYYIFVKLLYKFDLLYKK